MIIDQMQQHFDIIISPFFNEDVTNNCIYCKIYLTKANSRNVIKILVFVVYLNDYFNGIGSCVFTLRLVDF